MTQLCHAVVGSGTGQSSGGEPERGLVYVRYLLSSRFGAIDAAGCLLEYRDEEVAVARAMLRNARHKVLLADHTKFSRVATFKLGHLQDVTTLVTDRAPAGATATLLHEARCRMVLAERA